MTILLGNNTKLLGAYAAQDLEHRTTEGVIT